VSDYEEKIYHSLLHMLYRIYALDDQLLYQCQDNRFRITNESCRGRNEQSLS
jgi:hypothetical protein